MKVLRTPEHRFRHLPDFPFTPNYVEVRGEACTPVRMHYVDEGPAASPPLLMLHGEPSWSFLYRKMIPVFASAQRRAIAPDLVGFGKSDKPAAPSDYTYARHVAWLSEMIETLQLNDITLVCQDWGSLIGLRVATQMPDRFARIVVANGTLPTGRERVPLAFHVWRTFSRLSPVFPTGRIVAAGCVTQLSEQVRAAYDAPFPTRSYQAGARQFPSLVPLGEHDPAVGANRAAWEALGRWEKPFLTLFGKNDPILGKADERLQSHVPGARGQPHQRIWGGHFVQEDRGEYLAQAILAWLRG